VVTGRGGSSGSSAVPMTTLHNANARNTVH